MGTLLAEWMTKNYVTDSRVAVLLSAITRESISKQNVRAWRIGICKPSLHRRPAIEKMTKGKVKAALW